ncbi:MAG: hypothetical protein WCG06_06135 [Candidatus Omnitrophota bacterium]
MSRSCLTTGLFLGLLLAALVLASSDLEGALVDQGHYASKADVMQRIFGSAEEAVGDTLFLKADSYFHGGSAEPHEDNAQTLSQEGLIKEDPHAGDKQPQPADWIENVNRQILMHQHYHLSGVKKREMLPFLAWAAALDPHNTEAILTAAFWLGGEFNRPEEALKILQKGYADNPASWEIVSALGDYYFKRKNDFQQSRRYYRQAADLFDAKAGPAERQRLYFYLAESYDRAADRQNALSAYRKASAENPTGADTALKRDIRKKIDELSS